MTALRFGPKANTRGKTFGVVANGDITVASSEEWAVATEKGGKVTVKVSVNAGAERVAIVTVTDAQGKSARVTVTQEAAE